MYKQKYHEQLSMFLTNELDVGFKVWGEVDVYI